MRESRVRITKVTEANASTAGRHSSASNEHYSPPLLVEPARATLGGAIALDPFSCAAANATVRAARYLSLEKGEDGFAVTWTATTAFVNPPGGAVRGKSQQSRGGFKLAAEHQARRVEAAIFVCFSLELLQVTQISSPATLPLPLDFPICYPASRVAYYRESRTAALPGVGDGLEVGGSPPHASAIVYLPPREPLLARLGTDRFLEAFGPLGRCVVPSPVPASRARAAPTAKRPRRGPAGDGANQLDLGSTIPAPAPGV